MHIYLGMYYVNTSIAAHVAAAGQQEPDNVGSVCST
jgi:hypothetical protein